MRARHLAIALAGLGALALLAAAGSGGTQPAAPGAPATLDRTGSTVPAPTTPIGREGCSTTECHPGVKQHRFVHAPINVNACDGCHTLKDPEKHAFEPTRAPNELCILCHTADIPAGAKAHGPYAEGACLSCHDPHGSAEPAMLRGRRYADSCSSCHQDVTGAHDTVHGPASAGACGACHEPHASTHPKLLTAEGRDLCLRCHVSTGKEIENSSVVHAPAKGDCLVCHNPHATDQPGVLNQDPATLCISCHADIGDKVAHASTQHAAVTTKRACVNCHSAHGSENAGLLKDKAMSLCFECHNTVIELPDGTKLQNMKKVIEQGKSLHGVIAERSCVVCHDVHGGGHRRLLTNEYPSELYYPFSESAYALCFSCHDREMVMLQATDSATQFRNGSKNLHFAHVNRADKGRSCSVCHDAHAASRDKHIRDEVPFGGSGWRLPIKYESLADGGRCGAGCHAPLEYNRKTPVVYPEIKGTGDWKGEGIPPPEKPVKKKPEPPPAPAKKK